MLSAKAVHSIRVKFSQEAADAPRRAYARWITNTVDAYCVADHTLISLISLEVYIAEAQSQVPLRL